MAKSPHTWQYVEYADGSVVIACRRCGQQQLEAGTFSECPDPYGYGAAETGGNQP